MMLSVEGRAGKGKPQEGLTFELSVGRKQGFLLSREVQK